MDATLDFEAIADRADLPALVATEGIELHRGMAFCPFHDNQRTPALSVYQRGGRWRFKCHGCGKAGDAIDWVADRAGITTLEAARRLGGGGGYEVRAWDRPDRVEEPEPWRDPEWQRIVDDLVFEAEARLWSADGSDALRWLRSRGLADCTIRRFRLGFVASYSRSDPVPALADRRGEGRVYAPRGITIPWVAPRACYLDDEDASTDTPRWVGCNVRRLAEGDVFAGLPGDASKYMAVRGSSRGYLYPWPEILPTQGELSMLLVEGEFDALLGFQEVGHLLHVATAGSASVRTLPLASRSALALTTWLLLAFDHDEAGVEAAWEWRERYPHRSRRVLLPSGNDLSDFINGGGDAREWIAEIEDSLLDDTFD